MSSAAAKDSNTNAAGTKSSKGTKQPAPASNELVGWVWLGVAGYLAFIFGVAAYKIRMGAIEEYGRVIHEFDPYFNYRATEVNGTRFLGSDLGDEDLKTHSKSFFIVFVLERMGALHQMVRLHVMVSIGTSSRNDNIPWNASDGCVDQESCFARLVH